LVKKFDSSRFDFLFVLVSDGRCWFIPSEEIEGRRSIHVGGVKYAEFEIHPSRAITATDATDPVLESTPEPGEYPSGQRGGAVNAMAMPSQVRILPPPSFATQHANGVEARDDGTLLVTPIESGASSRG
jgi:hypothetical protein